MEEAKVIVSGNKVHRPILDETLTEHDLEVARDELHETPETKESSLNILKQRLLEQDEFKSRTDDVYLLRYLRCRKYDMDRAFKMIRDQYKFREIHPDAFLSPSQVEKVLRTFIYNYLPHRDHLGRVIYVVKAIRWDPVEVSYEDFFAAGCLVGEYVVDNPVTQINGYVGLWDFKGMNLKHFMSFCNPKNLILLTTYLQDRYPARFKVAFCINCPYLMHTAWKLIKPLLKEKFKKRIHIMGSNYEKELHPFIDPSILPEEYGGMIKAPEIKDIAQRVLDKEEYTNYNLKFGF